MDYAEIIVGAALAFYTGVYMGQEAEKNRHERIPRYVWGRFGLMFGTALFWFLIGINGVTGGRMG
jgi:uncharacterized membrane protein